jgi:SAM-dependent methyltransferase
VDKAWRFDEDFTRNYTAARQEVIGKFLADVKVTLHLASALDLGCGVGHFSKFLSDFGFRVVAVDGREENAVEGQRRYPEINFVTKNAEDPSLPEMGTFDFVLCAGLIYHLENPFRTIRSLHALTGKILIVETMCAPGDDPSLRLVDEARGEDQALNYVAFYPTEACLVKMLYRAGFPHVYAFDNLPDYPLFHASLWRRKERTMLVASKESLAAKGLRPLADIRGSWEILSTGRERWRQRFVRLLGPLSRFGRRIGTNATHEGRKSAQPAGEG